MKNQNWNILEQAIEELNHETPIRFEIQGTGTRAKKTNQLADAQINIGPYKNVHVEVKRHAQQAHVGILINQEFRKNKAPAVCSAPMLSRTQTSNIA